MESDDNFSLDVLSYEVSYHPWEFESCSESGFLLGDPFFLPSEGDTIHSRKPSRAFVLNEKSVLTLGHRARTIEMLHLDIYDEPTKDSADVSKTTVVKVVLSLNGDTLYVVTKTDGSPATLMAWDITSGMSKPGKRVIEVIGMFSDYNLVAVREGVLLQTSHNALELWNVELSECIRSWTDLEYMTEVIPISEERVACVGMRKVIIVDTTRKGILSTTTIKGRFGACNSKCHVITIDPDKELQMHCGDKVLWKMSWPPDPYSAISIVSAVHLTFSPSDQYCVLAIHAEFYVLDAVSGETLRTLQHRTHGDCFFQLSDCAFVSEEELVAWISDIKLGDHFLQLFNIKSGDLLSEIVMESHVYSLTACPRKRLVAICHQHSKVNFKVLRLKLPGDKHSRKSKRSGLINIK